MRLLTCEEMKLVEQHAANYGLSYSRMMENAGAACAKYIQSELTKNTTGKSVAVVCGKGNNGGDGFVIARKMKENGFNVIIIMAGGYPGSKEAELMYKMTADMNIPVIWCDGNQPRAIQAIRAADCIVDAVFGFSFYGNIREEYIEIFNEINDAGGYIFSVDLPSGTYCDSGFADSNCIKADYTVAISALKPAHIVHPAAECCGDIFIADIGIPAESFSYVKNSMFTLAGNEVSYLLPERQENSNKGDFGHLLIVAGSKTMPGASALATKAALKSGTGLVTCAFPESLLNVMSLKLTESLLMPLPETEDGAISQVAAEKILEKADKFTAILIGPGLSVCDDTRALVKDIIRNAEVPLILDADALNIIAEDMSILNEVKVPVILTPHPKEMSRLSNNTVDSIQASRVKSAKEFAANNNVFLILKGSNTVVASPNGESVFVNTSGNSGLAKGGSGDVLAGIVSGLIAQGISIATACAAAVYVHGHCADKAADRLSRMGMLPSDVIDELGRVWGEFE